MRREGEGAGMKSACETSARHAYCTATWFTPGIRVQDLGFTD